MQLFRKSGSKHSSGSSHDQSERHSERSSRRHSIAMTSSTGYHQSSNEVPRPGRDFRTVLSDNARVFKMRSTYEPYDGSPYDGRASGEIQGNVFTAPAGDFRYCCLSHEGTVALTAHENNAVEVWNTLSGSSQQFLQHTRPVRQVAISGNGQIGASASLDGTVRIWNTQTLVPHDSLRRIGFGWGQGAALSADGAILIATFVSTDASRGIVVHYDWRNRKSTRIWHGHGTVFECFVSHDGTRVVFVKGGGVIDVYDMTQKEPVRTFKYMRGDFHVGLDALGHNLVIADQKLCIQRLSDGYTITVNKKREGGVAQCDISGDGTRCIEIEKKTIRIRDDSGIEIMSLGSQSKLKCCRISADGTTIIACAPVGKLVVWRPDALPSLPVPGKSLEAPINTEIRDAAQTDAVPRDPTPKTSLQDSEIQDLTLGMPPPPLASIQPISTSEPAPPPPSGSPPPWWGDTPVPMHDPALPPPEPPAVEQLSPIEALFKDTLEMTPNVITEESLLRVLKKENVKSLSSLFAGHNIVLIALRSGVLNKDNLEHFGGTPYYLMVNLYLPFHTLLGQEGYEEKMLAISIFRHAEHLGLITDASIVLAASETYTAGREEWRRIDTVLQDLSVRVGALEKNMQLNAEMTNSLREEHVRQQINIDTLTANLNNMFMIMNQGTKALLFAGIAKCLLSLMPILGYGMGTSSSSLSGGEVFLSLSPEDLMANGIEQSNCIIDEVANIDMSNIQVARYVFSKKCLKKAGPVAEETVSRAARCSHFKNIENLCNALETEILNGFRQRLQIHCLDLGHSHWASVHYAGGANNISQQARELFEKHVQTGDETMPVLHAKIHIASCLALRGFKNEVTDDDIYDALEDASDDNLRISKDVFVAAFEALINKLGGAAPDHWRQEFEEAAKPSKDLPIRAAMRLLVKLWNETENKEQSIFQATPEKTKVREILSQYDLNKDDLIDKEEFVKALHFVISGVRQ